VGFLLGIGNLMIIKFKKEYPLKFRDKNSILKSFMIYIPNNTIVEINIGEKVENDNVKNQTPSLFIETHSSNFNILIKNIETISDCDELLKSMIL